MHVVFAVATTVLAPIVPEKFMRLSHRTLLIIAAIVKRRRTIRSTKVS